MHSILRIISLLSLSALMACSSQGTTKAADSEAQEPSSKVDVAFDADSAFSYVAKQTDFGPRVPNTAAHKACSAWLLEKLRELGASNVVEQRTQVKAYDGTPLDICNISARYNPDAKKRILLLSHWDSRPWADNDPDPAMRDKPIDGANDGASGVGVILELARQMGMRQPGIGVDVLFVDAEDYGARGEDSAGEDTSDTWCLGTQYWVQNPTLDLSQIRYAVLLDMVGGKDAVFVREYFSDYANSSVNDRVWQAARKAGYADRFPNKVGMPVMDDHVPLMRAGIPAIDIIECSHPSTQSFNPTWHTHADNISNIDKATLGAVGQTLVQLIYTE